MTETRIGGIIPVLATPFDEQGWVDVASFGAIVEAAIENGADALAMFGLASEYYKLSDEEREILMTALIGTVRKRVPVVISVTRHATELALRDAQRAEQMGADAVMILAPFFLSPSVDSVVSHIGAVADAVRIPLILQYAPTETGADPGLLARIAAPIVKVDAWPATPVVAALPKNVTKLVGYMGLDLPDAVAAGCQGCMPTASLTRLFANIWRSLRTNPNEGQEEHKRLSPLLRYMMSSVEFLIAAEKHLLVRQGVIRSAYCRHPRVSLGEDEVERLITLFREI